MKLLLAIAALFSINAFATDAVETSPVAPGQTCTTNNRGLLGEVVTNYDGTVTYRNVAVLIGGEPMPIFANSGALTGLCKIWGYNYHSDLTRSLGENALVAKLGFYGEFQGLVRADHDTLVIRNVTCK